MGILKEEQMEASVTYSIIAPWGPKVMQSISEWIPVFKDVFKDIEHFFASLSTNIEGR